MIYSKYSMEASIQRSLWDFSLNLYDNPLVDEACSVLQDRYQLNINMVFLCCWLAKENFRALTPEEIVSMITRVTPWNRRIVVGLVVLLRLAKRARNKSALSQLGPLLALEKKILNDKRFADKIEQSMMLPAIRNIEKSKNADPNKINLALTNVFSYINSQKTSIHQNDLEKIYRIVKACFAE